MAAIKVKLNVESSGLLSSPIKLLESESLVTTGVVQRIAKTISVEDGSAAVLLAKADLNALQKQATAEGRDDIAQRMEELSIQEKFNESIMTKYGIMDEEIDTLTKDSRILENVNNLS